MAGISVLLGMSVIMFLVLCLLGLLIVSFLLGTIFIIIFSAKKARSGKRKKGFLIGSIICYTVALPLGVLFAVSAVEVNNAVTYKYTDNGVRAQYNEEQGELVLNGKRYIDFWSCDRELIRKGTPIASVKTQESNNLQPIFQVENGAGNDMVAFSRSELDIAKLFVLDSQLDTTKAYYKNLANFEFTVHYGDNIRGLESTTDKAAKVELDGGICNPFVELSEAEEDIEKQYCPESYRAAEVDAVSKDGLHERTFTIIKAEGKTYLAYDPYYCCPLPEQLNTYLLEKLF
ncbi:hypothetical protein [Acetanaerobacterium elongatum]|uniref:Uncharacterized protein n=1 Tax=Acetanaerobacterium elongatum TaxID=258515 RepID=A0A1G9ZYX6_9FIRM|nr:hypothetical protein [Acetanaerobacterium elongatum]SDN25746.1 hypothetical protein SAMN05192585_11467 [Acetanaerobacterium elongatum]